MMAPAPLFLDVKNNLPTAADYKRERELRGTQATVAAQLGVHPVTVAKRESGAPDAPITREAWLALLSLPLDFDRPKRRKKAA